jgi:hypothetical protein
MPQRGPSLALFTFDQFSVFAVTYHVCLPALPALEEAMENFAELMQRLLEIQSGGRQRSPELNGHEDKKSGPYPSDLISALWRFEAKHYC